MPEGDVLARTARTLDAALVGEPIVRSELRWPSAAGVNLVGRTLLAVVSYGKHLLMRFDDGRTLHTHLRMEGSWKLAATGTPGARGGGEHVRAVLATERWTAVGDRLGMLDVLATRDEHVVLGHLGPDLLADDFPAAGLPEALTRFAARGATPVGDVLLDQTVAAGIGTIYLAESCHARRLWPWTPADEVRDPASLLMTARVLLARSVASDRPEERMVYGREGGRCRRCAHRVERAMTGTAPWERQVFWCPGCQVRGGAPLPG